MGKWEDEEIAEVSVPLFVEKKKAEALLHFEISDEKKNKLSEALESLGCRAPRGHSVNGADEVVCSGDRLLCVFYRVVMNRLEGTKKSCELGQPVRKFEEIGRELSRA